MTTPELLKIVRSLCAEVPTLALLVADNALSRQADDDLAQSVIAKAYAVERHLHLLSPRSPVAHIDAVRDLEAAVERLKEALR